VAREDLPAGGLPADSQEGAVGAGSAAAAGAGRAAARVWRKCRAARSLASPALMMESG